MDAYGYATLLAATPEGAEVYWPMAWDGTNSGRVDIAAPGMPGIAVAPGIVAGGTSDESLPDWTLSAFTAESPARTLTSAEFEGVVAEQPALDAEDLWVFLVGTSGSSLVRVPLAGGETEQFGVWSRFDQTSTGVLALATTWSHPDLSGFEVHHLGRGLDETLVTGTPFTGEFTQLAGSGSVTAMAMVVGQTNEPRLVVVDGEEALVVEPTGGVVSLDAAGRYVAWAQATTADGGPVDQFLLDLDTDTTTNLGLGAPTVTFPALGETTAAWSLMNTDGTNVVTATLP